MRAAALTLLVLGPAMAGADAREDAFNKDEAHQATALLDANPMVARVYSKCPADVFRREAALWEPLIRSRTVPQAYCSRDPLACLNRCVAWSSAAHCFSLARAFQEHEDEIKPYYAQMLFSAACAAGKGGGCTNRAAGMRNGRYEGDPFLDAPADLKDTCQYRSFAVACDQGDAWGCAMLGQSYHYGEGVRRDADRARRFYGESCRINPAFAACRFSESRIEALTRGAN